MYPLHILYTGNVVTDCMLHQTKKLMNRFYAIYYCVYTKSFQVNFILVHGGQYNPASHGAQIKLLKFFSKTITIQTNHVQYKI